MTIERHATLFSEQHSYTFHLHDLISNSPYFLPYSSLHFTIENTASRRQVIN